jgi:hypothetical protein
MGGVNGMPLNSLLAVILVTYSEYQDLGYHTVSGMLTEVLSYMLMYVLGIGILPFTILFVC